MHTKSFRPELQKNKTILSPMPGYRSIGRLKDYRTIDR